ncbi:hypothetical protein [Natronococcus sp.]|uniref:hypothetical protein n=1 Tax=Natronococcus sp. TaxID=35747 RepID=UPI003A4DF6B8
MSPWRCVGLSASGCCTAAETTDVRRPRRRKPPRVRGLYGDLHGDGFGCRRKRRQASADEEVQRGEFAYELPRGRAVSSPAVGAETSEAFGADGEQYDGAMAYHLERDRAELYWLLEPPEWEGEKAFWRLR